MITKEWKEMMTSRKIYFGKYSPRKGTSPRRRTFWKVFATKGFYNWLTVSIGKIKLWLLQKQLAIQVKLKMLWWTTESWCSLYSTSPPASTFSLSQSHIKHLYLACSDSLRQPTINWLNFSPTCPCVIHGSPHWHIPLGTSCVIISFLLSVSLTMK